MSPKPNASCATSMISNPGLVASGCVKFIPTSADHHERDAQRGDDASPLVPGSADGNLGEYAFHRAAGRIAIRVQRLLSADVIVDVAIVELARREKWRRPVVSTLRFALGREVARNDRIMRLTENDVAQCRFIELLANLSRATDEVARRSRSEEGIDRAIMIDARRARGRD